MRHPVPIKCVVCGKEHLSKSSSAYVRKYCSYKCQMVEKSQKSKVDCVCIFCGNHYIKRRGEFNKRTPKFCSRNCQHSWRREKYLPNKKDGWVLDVNGYYTKTRWAERKGVQRKCRYVMEQFLGRKLTSQESVHHQNGIKTDDRIENLELWASNHPAGQRVSDKIAWAIQLLEMYKYMVIPPLPEMNTHYFTSTTSTYDFAESPGSVLTALPVGK